VAAAKATAGTWRCKGEEWDDRGTQAPLAITTRSTVSPDGWWIVDSSDLRGRMPLKMVTHTTFDPAARKWRRVGVMTGGTHLVGIADPPVDGKQTFVLEMSGPMGAAQFRDVIDTSDPKAGMKASGSISMDRGKTWLPVYQATCKR
jgi:hypothetical protein